MVLIQIVCHNVFLKIKKVTQKKSYGKNMQISLVTLKRCILLFFRACSTGLSGMLVSGNVTDTWGQ